MAALEINRFTAGKWIVAVRNTYEYGRGFGIRQLLRLEGFNALDRKSLDCLEEIIGRR